MDTPMDTSNCRPSTSFAEVFSQHKGKLSDKWMQYLTIYQRELGHLTAENRPLRLLEIGVQNGGSLEIWKTFLPDGSQITGIDIEKRCADLTFGDNIEIIIADCSDKEALETLLDGRTFDIIIDDGSHKQSHILISLSTLFKRLAPRGLYIIEDLHAAYWRSHEGGFRKQGTAIETLKGWIDALHTDHFEPPTGLDQAEQEHLASLNRELARVAFYDSVAVLEKYPDIKESPFLRVVSGDQMQVTGSWIADDIARNRQRFLFTIEGLTAFHGPVVDALEAARADLAQRNADLESTMAQYVSAQSAGEPLPDGAQAASIEAIHARHAEALAAVAAERDEAHALIDEIRTGLAAAEAACRRMGALLQRPQ